jgi:hypothetical protein
VVTDEDDPALVTSPDRLTGRERRVVGLAALVPIALAAAVLTPVAVVTGAGAGEVAGASLVYGGLVGLAAAFVAVDRLQARQCPRCHRRAPRGEPTCACGYDLAERPRYACEHRHAVYLEPGSCACGRRMQRLQTARGVGPQVIVSLKIGGLLLGFLVVVGIALRLLEGTR